MNNAKTISDDRSPTLPWEVFPQPGDRFATYTLGEMIGRGSFGAVFKVQSDPQVDWYEAVKILHRSGDINKKRFLAEINRLKEIRLPGLVKIHAAGEFDGYLYYCMDYVEGLTIDEFIERDGRDRLFPLFLELCDTVQKLHELSFIHRDIKPCNVMVNEEGQVKLLDLGIACKSGEATDVAANTPAAGTYEFAAPEQINGHAPDESMDVFSLGCLLYTLLTSAHPKIPYDPFKREKPYGKFYPESNLQRPDLVAMCLQNGTKNIADYDILIGDKVSQVIMNSLRPAGQRYRQVKDFKEGLVNGGALLKKFLVVAVNFKDQELVSRIATVVDETALEFSQTIQIFFKKDNEAYDQQVDLLLTGKKESKDDGFLVTSSQDIHEKLAKELRHRLFETITDFSNQQAWSHSPYKSLNSYTAEEASLFFGRDQEVIDIYSQLTKMPDDKSLLAVLAPSGAGKSSFLQAGLIPYFKSRGTTDKDSQAYFCLPGASGFGQLKSDIDHFIKSHLKSEKLIIIDQFEEFLHGSQGLKEMARQLHHWAAHENTRLIISLRNDYYKEYISFLEVGKLPDHFYNLPQPNEVNLLKMIRMPAIKAHLVFEKDPLSGKALDETLRDEAMLNPENLAALSFTLDEVFAKSPRGRMSCKVYNELGGMHGAMAKRAESLFQSLKLKKADYVFHQVFHQLIQVDENHIPRRLYANYDKLTTSDEAKLLTDEFIKAKLFQVSKETLTNNRIVTVSHEALIQQHQENGWHRVMDWLTSQRSNLLVRKRLAVAVNDWIENKQQRRFLYSSYSRLHEILALRKSGWAFTDKENHFIKLSYRAILRNAAVVGVSLFALVWISLSLWEESNTVDDLTKNINARKAEVTRLAQEADAQRTILESLEKQEVKVKQQLSAMNDYNRLSLISSLQQSGTLSSATAISLLSEVNKNRRNWLWGRLLSKSLPDYLMLFGHAQEILSVQFSPDKESKYMLTSSWDDTVRLWDGKNGAALGVLKWEPFNGVRQDFEDASFSYDGYAVAANNDGYLYLWEIAAGSLSDIRARAVRMPHVKIRKLFFSRDNKYMTCAGSEGKFSIWDWKNKDFTKPLALATHVISTEEDKSRVYSAEISPDGKTLISAGWDGRIKRWRWDGKSLGGGEVVGADESQIWSGTFSPDGRYYLSAGRDRVARLWDAKSFKLIREYGGSQTAEGHKSDIRIAVFSPDGQAVITAGRDKKVRFWDLQTGELTLARQTHDNMIYDLAFSSDGQRFSSVGADRLVNLCYVDNFMSDNAKSDHIIHHPQAVVYFDFLKDTLVTASADGMVRLWDLHSGILKSALNHPVPQNESLLKCFILDRNRVISADSKGGIHLWKLTGKVWHRESLVNKVADDQLCDLALTKNKDFVAAAFTDGKVKIWDLALRQVVFEGRPAGLGKDPVIAFSEDPREIVCGDYKGKLVTLDWPQNKVLRTWQGHDRKIFALQIVANKSGQKLISSSRDGYVKIWDGHGEQIDTVSHGVRGGASYASMSSDGLFMTTVSPRDNNVFIWDLYNDIELLPLAGHQEPISRVEFINDDLIISASMDGTVRLWRSLSWKKLQSELSEADKELSSLQLLQKAVRLHTYGARQGVLE